MLISTPRATSLLVGQVLSSKSRLARLRVMPGLRTLLLGRSDVFGPMWYRVTLLFCILTKPQPALSSELLWSLPGRGEDVRTLIFSATSVATALLVNLRSLLVANAL